MSKPRLGVDIDDVLAQTGVWSCKRLLEVHGFELSFEHIVHHDYTQIPGFPLTMDEIMLFWKQELSSEESLMEIEPMAGSVESILFLREHFELHAITARNPAAEISTRAWLNKHYGDAFVSIDHLGLRIDAGIKNKGDACAELGVVAMIEDNMSYALTVAEK